MTKIEAYENAKVFMAWAEGKPIQFRFHRSTEWWDFRKEDEPSWNFSMYRYRVKPDDDHTDQMFIGVTKRGETTNYVVLLDSTEAISYPCDRMLRVQVTGELEREPRPNS